MQADTKQDTGRTTRPRRPLRHAGALPDWRSDRCLDAPYRGAGAGGVAAREARADRRRRAHGFNYTSIRGQRADHAVPGALAMPDVNALREAAWARWRRSGDRASDRSLDQRTVESS